MRVWFGGPRILGVRTGVSFGPEDLRRLRSARPTVGAVPKPCSFVYVIDDGRGGTKIGATSDPSARLRSLQTASPTQLRFAFIGVTSRDGYELEAEAHSILDGHRVRGDWFSVSPELAMTAVTGAAARLGHKLLPVDQRRADEILAVVSQETRKPGSFTLNRNSSFLRGMLKGFAFAAVIFVAFCIFYTVAFAQNPQDDVLFKQGGVRKEYGHNFITYSVKNVSGYTLQSVFVECASLDKDGNPLRVGDGMSNNVRANETVYGEAPVELSDREISFACRVSNVVRTP